MMASRWTDAYALTLADQLALEFGPLRPTLLRVDPSIPFAEMDRLLEEASERGASVEPGSPEKTTVSAEAARLIPRLIEIVERIRAAGARAFDPDEDRAGYIICSAEYPLLHFTIPDTGSGALHQILLLNFGDAPPTSPRWRTRARVLECQALRVLYLYGNGLTEKGLDIQLDRLPALEVLDLGDNRLRTLPDEVLGCGTLRWLRLNLNPITALPDLSPLRNLRHLELSATSLKPEQIEAVGRALPECHVIGNNLNR